MASVNMAQESKGLFGHFHVPIEGRRGKMIVAQTLLRCDVVSSAGMNTTLLILLRTLLHCFLLLVSL